MAANEGKGGLWGQITGAIGGLFGGGLTDAQQLDVEVLFGLIGYLAKADGLITSYESEFANQLMDELKLPLDGRAIALASFEGGRNPAYEPEPDITRFLAAHSQGSTDQVEKVIESLLRLSLSDGRMYARERQALERVAAGFGLSETQLEVRLRALRPS